MEARLNKDLGFFFGLPFIIAGIFGILSLRLVDD